ncbi:STAS domain-containing protein [Streptomyces sp. NPDC028722]|uniref:STAS domain-containing protein n=1 Tax=Streptomyces sp. NPDC028722 TaxID=3155016 RepID=UPI0033DC35B9
MTRSPAPRPGPVPVLALGDVLLVTLQGELHDEAAEQLRSDIVHRIGSGPAPVGGVVIDVSGVEMVDSFLGRVLAEIAASARLLATRTVLAGMRPAVAITLVELGLTLPGLVTALDVGRALSLLTDTAPEALPGHPAHPAPAHPAHPEEGA